MLAWLLHTASAAALAAPAPATAPAPAELVEVGADAGRGNVVAVQTWLTPADYASADTLEAALDRWLAQADEAGWLGPASVVVLPEYVGTWLVAVDARPRVHRAPTTRKAMSRVVWSNLGAWRRARRAAPVEDAATYGVFAARAEAMATSYQTTMSALAARYGVTLVAGSILLPEPSVVDGRIAPGAPGAPLQNVAFVFDADGAVVGEPVRKAYPTADEQGFVDAVPPAGTLFDAPVGAVGVLICADAWYPPAWEALAAAGAEIVAVPQYTSGQGTWSAPWGGYSGHPAPDDVRERDVGAVSEADAWASYAVPGRAAGVEIAVTAPLRGELWDLGTDGQIRWRTPEGHGEGPLVDGPVLLAVWR